MKNSLFALLLAGVALAACEQRPAPSPGAGQVLPPSKPRQLATFTATYEPPQPGPGMGHPAGQMLWNIIPTGTGLGPDANPPRTIQLRSIGVFGQPVSATNGACTRYITVPVEIKNFFPERLVDIYVVLTGSDTGNGLCNPGTKPIAFTAPPNDDGSTAWDAPPVHAAQLGIVNYVVPNQYPRNAMAGSLVESGGTAGGVTQVDWAFNYPSDVRFVIRGEVWADPFPNAPRAWGTFGWLNHAEVGEWAGWGVYDRKDDWENPRQQVTPTNIVWIYDGYDAGSGLCTGNAIVSAKSVASNSNGVTFTNFNMFLPDTAPNAEYPSTTLTPGNQYCFRAVNRWTPTGAGAQVTGSFAMNEPFIATGRPELIPTASPLVGSTATFSWTIVAPAKTNYVEYPLGTPFFVVCSTADCTGGGDPLIVGTGTNYGTQPGNNLITGTDNLDGSWTFEVTPSIAGLGPGTYYWRVRQAFEGRQGEWTAPLSFTR